MYISARAVPKTNKYSAKVQRKKTTVLWLFRSYYVLSYRSSYTLMYIWCTIGAHLLGTSLSVTHEGCPGQRSALTQCCPVQFLSWLRTVRNSAQLWLRSVLYTYCTLYSVHLGWALSRTTLCCDWALSQTSFSLTQHCPKQCWIKAQSKNLCKCQKFQKIICSRVKGSHLVLNYSKSLSKKSLDTVPY